MVILTSAIYRTIRPTIIFVTTFSILNIIKYM